MVSNTSHQPLSTTTQAAEPDITQSALGNGSSSFFQQAPLQVSPQRQLLDFLTQGQNILASFSADESPISVYSLPALTLPGMAVVIGLDSATLTRNQRMLRGAGYSFPDIAVLDGHQTLDEENHIFRAINHHQVKLLMVTPEKWTSLPVLQQIARERLSFIGIEDAQCLLPGLPGHYRYQKIWESFRLLQHWPPVVLFTLPISVPAEQLLRQLWAPLHFQPLSYPIEVNHKTCRVVFAKDDTQKLRWLMQSLLGEPSGGVSLRMNPPEKILIKVRRQRTLQRLAAALAQSGISDLSLYHDALPADERFAIEQQFLEPQPSVVISSSIQDRGFRLNSLPVMPPGLEMMGEGPSVHVVYAEIPHSLDEMLTVWLQPSARPLELTVLFNKTDYRSAEQWIQTQPHQLTFRDSESLTRELSILADLQAWVYDKSCRVNSLMAYWQGRFSLHTGAVRPTPTEALKDVTPCGQCDHCLLPHLLPSMAGTLRQLLRRWVYS